MKHNGCLTQGLVVHHLMVISMCVQIPCDVRAQIPHASLPQEHGPQHVNNDAELEVNPYSWNKYANML